MEFKKGDRVVDDDGRHGTVVEAKSIHNIYYRRIIMDEIICSDCIKTSYNNIEGDGYCKIHNYEFPYYKDYLKIHCHLCAREQMRCQICGEKGIEGKIVGYYYRKKVGE